MYTSQLKIDLSKKAFEERDREIMLTVLKVLVVLHEKKEPMIKSVWDGFFNEIFPKMVRTDNYGNECVVSVGVGLDWLQQAGFIKISPVPKKRYKLITINPSSIQKIIIALDNNVMDYDDDLDAEINRYYQTTTLSKGDRKYKSTSEAYASLFGMDKIIDDDDLAF